MKQQINLLNTLPQRARDYFSAANILKALGGFILFLILIYGYAYWNASSHNKRVIILTAKQKAAEKELAELTLKYPKAANSSGIEKDIADLNRQVTERNRLIEILKQQGAFNTAGFSSYLQGLSEAVISGVWITKITLSDGGGKLILIGKALNASAVLEFVKKLHTVKVFNGMTFKVGSLKKSAPDSERVEFDLQGATDDTK